MVFIPVMERTVSFSAGTFLPILHTKRGNIQKKKKFFPPESFYLSERAKMMLGACITTVNARVMNHYFSGANERRQPKIYSNLELTGIFSFCQNSGRICVWLFKRCL